MKINLQRSHALISLPLALAAGLFLFYSCTKEAKSSGSIQALSTAETINSTAALPAGIDTAGLVAWYDFNSGSLKDKSSYHNDIKFNSAAKTTDRNGETNNAYYFGGHNYMRVPNSPSLNPAKDITLFAIVKVSDFNEGLCHGNRIFNKSYDDNEQGDYFMDFNDNFGTNGMNCSQDVVKTRESFTVSFGNGGEGRSTFGVDTTAFVQTGHWYHLVFTYSKGVSHFYIDGQLVYSTLKKAVTSPNSEDLYIGMENKANKKFPYYFNGTIDQIGIFNVALNADQVARLSAY